MSVATRAITRAKNTVVSDADQGGKAHRDVRKFVS